jgi:hypothetical protein
MFPKTCAVYTIMVTFFVAFQLKTGKLIALYVIYSCFQFTSVCTPFGRCVTFTIHTLMLPCKFCCAMLATYSIYHPPENISILIGLRSSECACSLINTCTTCTTSYTNTAYTICSTNLTIVIIILITTTIILIIIIYSCFNSSTIVKKLIIHDFMMQHFSNFS